MGKLCRWAPAFLTAGNGGADAVKQATITRWVHGLRSAITRSLSGARPRRSRRGLILDLGGQLVLWFSADNLLQTSSRWKWTPKRKLYLEAF